MITGDIGAYWRGFGAQEFHLAEGLAVPSGFQLGRDGRYQFDAGHPAYRALAGNELLLLTMPVRATDGAGHDVLTLVRVLLRGGASPSGRAECVPQAEPDDAAVQLDLADAIGREPGELSFIAVGVVPPGFTISQMGGLEICPSLASLSGATAGGAHTLSMLVKITAPKGASGFAQIIAVLQETVGFPFLASLHVSFKRRQGEATFGVLSMHPAAGRMRTQFSLDGAGIPGFSLAQDGRYDYDPTFSFGDFGEGDWATVSIPVVAAVESGQTSSILLFLRVIGGRDGLTVVSEEVASFGIDENVLSGELVQTTDKLSSPVRFSLTEQFPGFSLDPRGCFVFDPNDFAFESMDLGDTMIGQFSIKTAGSNREEGEYRLMLSVSGTQSLPVATISCRVYSEQSRKVLVGKMNFSRPDSSGLIRYQAGGPVPAGFSLDPLGDYQFDYSGLDYTSMSIGDQRIMVVPVVGVDQEGGRSCYRLVINLWGTRGEPALLCELKGQCAGDDLLVIGSMDQGGRKGLVDQRYHFRGDCPDGLQLSAEGLFCFDPGHPSYKALATAERRMLTLFVELSDAMGLRGHGLLKIILTGGEYSPAVSIHTMVREGAEGIELLDMVNMAEELLDPGLLLDNGLIEDRQLGVSGPEVLAEAVSSQPLPPGAEHNESAAPERRRRSLEGIPRIPLMMAEYERDQLQQMSVSGGGYPLPNVLVSDHPGDCHTVLMWVKASIIREWKVLFGGGVYALVLLGGRMGFSTGRGDFYGCQVSELQDGLWHQIVAIFTNEELGRNRIYVDGIAKEMIQFHGRPTAGRANLGADRGLVSVGGLPSQQNAAFHGEYGLLQLFPLALSEAEIMRRYRMQRLHIPQD